MGLYVVIIIHCIHTAKEEEIARVESKGSPANIQILVLPSVPQFTLCMNTRNVIQWQKYIVVNCTKFPYKVSFYFMLCMCHFFLSLSLSIAPHFDVRLGFSIKFSPTRFWVRCRECDTKCAHTFVILIFAKQYICTVLFRMAEVSTFELVIFEKFFQTTFVRLVE